MKYFDKKDILTLVTYKDAERYINCEGYFSDSFYKDLNKWYKGILKDVDEDAEDYPFLRVNDNTGTSIDFRFFIPACKVKEIEEPKKWRPYKSLNEFDFKPGDLIRIRQIYDHKCEYLYLITGFKYAKNSVCMDGDAYPLEYLFNRYERFNNNAWQPFGVEVKEE